MNTNPISSVPSPAVPAPRFSVLRLGIGLALSAPVAVVAACIYGVLVYANPLLYFNVVATVILSLGLASAVRRLGAWSRLRSLVGGAALGAVLGGGALYASWVAWLGVATTDSMPLLYAPAEMWSAMRFIAREGLWSVGDLTPSGIVLWGIWFAEAGLVVGLPVMAGTELAITTVLDERSVNQDTVWAMTPADTGSLRSAV